MRNSESGDFCKPVRSLTCELLLFQVVPPAGVRGVWSALASFHTMSQISPISMVSLQLQTHQYRYI